MKVFLFFYLFSDSPGLRGLAGTKPYMSPEMFKSTFDPNCFYSYSSDWWSLGVTAFEMLTGIRPFDIHSRTTCENNLTLITANCPNGTVKMKENFSPEIIKFIQALLTLKPEKRLCSVSAMKKQKVNANLNFDTLLSKKVPPPFVPDNHSLNCDPTYELEEMILETKPLHKKKKRLLRQQTLLTQKAMQQARQQVDSKRQLQTLKVGLF